MKKIDQYIIKKFLGTFFYAISLLIVIVIIFDISEKIDDFLENDVPLNEIIFSYYLNFIPYFLNLFIYLFTFISVIFFTSKLASNTEIIAILSSGVSFTRLLSPYLISGLILAVISFYLANFLIPKTNQKMREFKGTYMEKLSRNKDRNIHLQIHPGTFVYVERFNTHILKGNKFTIEKFKDHKLYYKLRAKSIKWDTVNLKWTINDYYIRTINGKKEKLIKGTRIDTTLNLSPSDLYIEKEDFEEMDYWELNRTIKSKKMKGAENVMIYEVEKSKRVASPFATLVMTLIGMSLSCRKVRGGIGMHLGLGIAIAFAFILFMQVSTVFATFGNLPPYLSAWIPNIIFGILGIFFLITAPK